MIYNNIISFFKKLNNIKILIIVFIGLISVLLFFVYINKNLYKSKASYPCGSTANGICGGDCPDGLICGNIQVGNASLCSCVNYSSSPALIIGTNRFRLNQGNQYNSPSLSLFDTNLISQKSQTFYSTVIARNWPIGQTSNTQWNDIFLVNPNNSQANVTIKVYSASNGAGKTNGQLIATLNKTIPANGWFNTYADQDWLNLPDNYDASGKQTLAWVEINSNVPIIGTNRFRLNQGNQYNSPSLSLFDTNLISQKSQTFYSTVIARNWPIGQTSNTQWNDIFLVNPNNSQANVTIKVYSASNGAGKTNGQLIATLNKTIPANGWFNTYADQDWLNLPDNYDASGKQTLAWVEINSNVPIIGTNRFRLNQGNQYNSPSLSLFDTNLISQKSQTFYSTVIARNWPIGQTSNTQWNDIFLVNPNNSQANVTIKVYSASNGAGKTNGQLIATLNKTIPANGWFNTYADQDWLNLPDNYDASGKQTLAWVEINSNVPIIGTNRFRLNQGNQYNSPSLSLFDTNLISQKSQTFYSTVIARNWPIGQTSNTQWNDIFLVNPNNSQANVTIKVYSASNGAGKTNGQLIATLNKTIPANGWFNTYADQDWLNLPDNYDASGKQTLAWVEITSELINILTPTLTPTPANNSPTATPTPANNSPTATPTPANNSPTATPRPNATNTPIQTPTATPRPNATNTPIQTPTATPRPNATNTPIQTPTPTIVASDLVNLNLKLKFQGIMTQPQEDNQKTFKIKIKVGGGSLAQTVSVEENFSITNNRNKDTEPFIWEKSFNLPSEVIPGSNYYILIKGPKHIQKRICDDNPNETWPGTYRCFAGKITLSGGVNILDFSKIYLLVGDLPVNGSQDGVVDALDISYIRNNLGKTDEQVLAIADLNLDGKVDTQDYSAVIAALSIKNDEE
ncbi:MAG: hypothetical protein KatS3mg092_0638 [Patescibacteria group bacterium]|nr:MAG: hypothetical protein KatS3mg092_0638 [Patescibacteria group bacterium]